MLRILFALGLGLHGVGHALFAANAWGYWKPAGGRAWLFADLLHVGQPVEGTLGLIWIVPLLGFGAASWGLVAGNPRWYVPAFSAALLSTLLLLVWWGSLNLSSAVFALLFNVALLIGMLWQRPPLLLLR